MASATTTPMRDVERRPPVSAGLMALAGLAVLASALLSMHLAEPAGFSAVTVGLIVVIIGGAFLGEALFGFAGGLVAVPLVSLLVGIKEAVVLVLLFQVAMGVLLLRNHGRICWEAVRLIAAGLVVGVLLGSVSLVMLPEGVLRLILAAFIVLFLAKAWLLRERSLVRGQGRLLGSLAGAMGGWFHGMIGTGGPPFVMFLSELKVDKAAFRATLIGLLFACNLARVGVGWYTDLFTAPLLLLSVPVWPVFAVALLGGQRLHPLISENAYRYGVYVLLVGAALSLIAKGVLA